MSDIVKILRGDMDGPMYPYSTILELHRGAADEIEHLQAAKRRALTVADERSKENVGLRAEIRRLLKGVANIRDYLDQSRIGDASFICEALLQELVKEKQ